MVLGLTNLNIEAVAGNAALLPNQPIIQGCKVSADLEDVLIGGDVVKLVNNNDNIIVVDKATKDDKPCGVVLNSVVRTGWKANDYVSVFPVGSFVYVKGTEDIECGAYVGLNDDGEIDIVSDISQNVLGIAWTKPKANGGLFILQIKPDLVNTELTSLLDAKQNNLNLDDTLAFTDTFMYAWEGEIVGDEIVYTKSATPSSTGVVVYYLENGKYEILVDDATYSDSKLAITLAGTVYNYSRNDDYDTQSEFLGTVTE